LGNSTLSAVRREEVVENGCVDRSHSALTEVIVVGFDLRRAVVVRVLNQCLNQVGVLNAELTEIQSSSEKSVVLKGRDKAVKLLFLVAESVFLNHYRPSQVLEQVSAESLHTLSSCSLRVGTIDSLAFVVCLFIELEELYNALSLTFSKLSDRSYEFIVFSLGKVGNVLTSEVIFVACLCSGELSVLIASEGVFLALSNVLCESFLEISLN